MNYEQLRRLGWKPFFQQQLVADDSENLFAARVSAHHGSQVLLLTEDGELAVHSQLAESAGSVAVGDWLLVAPETHRTARLLERQTLLTRKAAGEEVRSQLIAANIDTMFIVCSCNEDFNLSRIERYLAIALQAGSTPIVVLTKSDLCDDVYTLKHQAEQLRPGLLVEAIDARVSDDASILESWCESGQTVALLGSSGVGKSTLANTLGAATLATGEIRDKDGKGRHTTTSRSLHLLPAGGVLIDNPGMRELQLPDCEDGVATLFDDVGHIADRCQFDDCRHEGDRGCAFPDAIADGEIDERRFASFMKLNAEQAHNSRSLSERRERDKKFGKMYKSIISEKQQRQGR